MIEAKAEKIKGLEFPNQVVAKLFSVINKLQRDPNKKIILDYKQPL